MTILIVDDDKFIRRIVEAMIREVNPYCTIVHADSADKAFETLRQTPVHLMVLDLNMPRVHGAAVLQVLRQSKALASLPVVVVSSETDAGVIATVLKLGVADYIMKPMDTKDTPKRLSVLMSSAAQQANLVHIPDSIGNVLLVGRDREFRQMFQEYLMGNFTITAVESEHQARKKFIDTKPDAVFFMTHDTDRKVEYDWQNVLQQFSETLHVCKPRCFFYSPQGTMTIIPEASILTGKKLVQTLEPHHFIRDVIYHVVEEEGSYNLCVVDFLRRQLIRRLLSGMRKMLRDAGDSILGYQAHQAEPSGYQIAVEAILVDTSKQFSLRFGIYGGRDELLALGSLLLKQKITMLQTSCDAIIVILRAIINDIISYFAEFQVDLVETSLSARLTIERLEQTEYAWHAEFPFTHQLTKNSFTAFIGVEHHQHHSTMRDTIIADDKDELQNEFFPAPDQPTPL
jgi:CheY-like chemotaxis protein